MALPRITADLNIISALADEPNDVGGLSAAELKAKFDEAGNTLQDYINNTLLASLETNGANGIGFDPISGLSDAHNVQEALALLKSFIDNVSVGDIPDASLSGRKLIGSSITERELAALSVATVALKALAVTTEKIAPNAVTTEKLAGEAVGTANLQNLSVTTEKLADNAVDSGKMASGAVLARNIGTGAVQTTHLGMKSVTMDKLASGARNIQYTNLVVTPEQWTADSSYENYPYRASIPIEAASTDHTVAVVFDPDSDLTDLCPVAEAVAEAVYVYAAAALTEPVNVLSVTLMPIGEINIAVMQTPYTGTYNVIPDTKGTVLDTDYKVMEQDVTVEGIPMQSVTNETGGNTVTIGGM